jgi:GT2 family glycosyltransferase
MRASIIIVNYNGLHNLEQCLNSVLKSNDSDAEIIVVDNASQDGSIEMVKQNFPQVSLICLPENVGFGEGNNRGASQANGDYLAFLNPDTVVESNWLKALIEPLETDPSAGMVTSKILLLNKPETINTCGNDIHISGLTLCRGMGCPATDYNLLKSVAAISGAAFALRRDLFNTLTGFDPLFFLYMEDTDLSWRVRLAGYRCLFVPNSIVYHDYTLRFGPRKIFFQERNRYLMLLKCLRWPTLIVLMPTLIFAEVVTWGFTLWRDRSSIRNKLSAYGWIWSSWHQIMIKRSTTQGLRRQTRDRDLLALMTARIDYGQTGNTWVSKLAALIFDPLFTLLRGLVLIVVWW